MTSIARHSTILMVVAVVIISSIGARPLMEPWFPVTFDGDLHVIRVFHLGRELEGGQFPVRWSGDQNAGYGYPTFNFYYQLPYYAAVGLHHLGLPAADSIKVLIAASLIATGLFMALWIGRIWGAIGGLVAGSLFSLSPALLQATYLILAFGELLSMAFFAAAMWAYHESTRSTRASAFHTVLSGFLLAGAVLSHNLLGVFSLGIVLAYSLFLSYARRGLRPSMSAAVSVAIALGVSAYFWFPAIQELQYTWTRNPAPIRFNPRLELLDVSLGPAIEHRDANHFFFTREMLGPPILIAIALAPFALIAFRTSWSRLKKAHLAFCYCSLLALILLVAAPMREELWHTLPLLKHAQYASRLLLPLAFFGAAIGGATAAWARWRPVAVGSVVIGAVVFGVSFARPAAIESTQDSYFLAYRQQMAGVADWGSPIMPMWAAFPMDVKSSPPVATLSNGGTILASNKQSTQVDTSVAVSQPTVMTFSVLYFPGWQATIGGTPTEIHIVPEAGTISVAVPPGEHQVNLRFVDTPARSVGNSVSLVSAAGCTIMLAILGAGAILQPWFPRRSKRTPVGDPASLG